MESRDDRLRLLESVVGNARDAVVLTDFDAAGEPRIVFVNPAFTAQTGYTAADVVGRHPRMLVGPDSDYDAQLRLRRAAEQRTAVTVELWHYRKDGTTFAVENAVNPIVDAEGNCTHLVSIQRDVTERNAALEALRQSERRFRLIIERASDVITVLARDGSVAYWSPAASRLVGLPDDASPDRILDLIHDDDRARLADAIRATARAPGATEPITFRVEHADGSWRHIEAAATNLLDDAAVRGIVLISRDITERKLAEERLAHQALHDALTGLANRTLLVDRLNQALTRMVRAGGRVGLLVMDLDRFKTINDTLGHEFGDRVLEIVAQRIAAVVRTTDTVARLGGDEFAFVLPDLSSEEEVELVTTKVLLALQAPVDVAGMTIQVDASIGVALAPDHGTDASVLMQRADVAMYRAKQQVTGYAVYTGQSDDQRRSGLGLMIELRQAITDGALELHYQPVVDLRSGNVVAVEALVRWHHRERGLLQPDTFIPLAEETGVIRPLTDWMLDAALAQQRQWRDAGWDIRVSVNLSARLVADQDLPDRILASLAASGVAPAALQLEITESAVMVNPEWALAVFHRLADAGVRLTLDDFGTGYSSLSYLKKLPTHQIKVDKSFVLDMVTDAKDRSIVRSVIELGHNLGLTVVAEGVEHADTLTALAAQGCDFAQGFLFGHPSPAAAFPALAGKDLA